MLRCPVLVRNRVDFRLRKFNGSCFCYLFLFVSYHFFLQRSYSSRFEVGPKPAKDAPAEAEKPEPTVKPTATEKLDDAVRDLKIDHLGKLTPKEKEEGKFEEMYAAIEKDYPDHLPLHMAKLQKLDTDPKRSELLDDIISAADAIVSRISEDTLALNLGRKVDDTDGDALKERETISEQKTLLIEALVRLALACADTKTEEASIKFEKTVKRLQGWVDLETETKYAALNIQKEVRAKRYGLALKQINQLLAKDAKDLKEMIQPLGRSDLLKKRAEIFAKLGFPLLVEYDKSTRVIACPKNYAPF